MGKRKRRRDRARKADASDNDGETNKVVVNGGDEARKNTTAGDGSLPLRKVPRAGK